MAGLKEKVAKGALWVTLERFSCQIVQFIVSMVLARLLTPNDYGTVALLSIFFAIAGSLSSCGFGNALVQKKDVSDLDFNSVFYTSIAVSLVIYAAMFFAAPWIAAYYDKPVLCPITRISAIHFVLSAINSVQGAELSRKMLFHKRFRISLVTSFVSSVLGISFAYMGWGVWALVWSSLLTSVASVVAWWMIIEWRPKWMYSFDAVKSLFSYGWKLSLSGMIHTTYSNLYGFLVGKVYSPADLAFVNKGNSMPSLLMSMVDGTTIGVSFPALAKLQSEPEKLCSAMRRMIQCSTFLVFPLMVGLAVCARPITLLLYGPQWDTAVPYVQIACFSFAVLPFNTINTTAISAMGRSDVFLYLEIIKKSVGVLLMFLSIKHGVFFFMCVMALVQAPFATVVNTFANGRLLKYNLSMQLKDVAPAALSSAIMAGAILCLNWFASPLVAKLPFKPFGYFVIVLLDCLTGTTIYFGIAAMFKVQALREYVEVLLPKIKTKHPALANKIARVVGL